MKAATIALLLLAAGLAGPVRAASLETAAPDSLPTLDSTGGVPLEIPPSAFT